MADHRRRCVSYPLLSPTSGNLRQPPATPNSITRKNPPTRRMTRFPLPPPTPPPPSSPADRRRRRRCRCFSCSPPPSLLPLPLPLSALSIRFSAAISDLLLLLQCPPPPPTVRATQRLISTNRPPRLILAVGIIPHRCRPNPLVPAWQTCAPSDEHVVS